MQEFQPIIDELMIKHGAGMYTSPEWRLALAIGATVMTVNAANNNPEMARAMQTMNSECQGPLNSNSTLVVWGLCAAALCDERRSTSSPTVP